MFWMVLALILIGANGLNVPGAIWWLLGAYAVVKCLEALLGTGKKRS